MREMKDSGVDWIGAIPKDWDILNLKYVASLKTGGTPQDKVGISDEGDIPWITPQDLNDSFFINTSSQYIDSNSVKMNKYSLFPPQSTLLVCIASIGKVGISTVSSYSNQQITALMPNKKIYPLYLYLCIKASEKQLLFDASSSL